MLSIARHSSCTGALAVAPLLAALALPAASQRKPGNPTDELPRNMEVVSHFGERADISPDDRRIAFIDIWKLKLDGTGKDFTRLTHFNDYEGGKASNPVVSRDGRFMAFQAAKTTDAAGVGYGIILYWFSR